MRDSGRVSIIVLCHDRWGETRRCLDSLRKNTPAAAYELLAYDNASSDGTYSRLQRLAIGWPQLRVLRNERNLTFARAVNRGMLAARGSLLLWLNNDTVLTSGWLEGLLKSIEPEDVAGAGPVTDHMAPPGQLAAPFKNRRKPESREEPFLGGFCFLVKRKAIEAVGLLDERFVWGWEDMDYCIRLRQGGRRLVLAENVFVYHAGNRTIQDMDRAERLDSDCVNRNLILSKWNYVEPFGGELRHLFEKIRAPLAQVRPIISVVTLGEGARRVAALNDDLRQAPGDFLVIAPRGKSIPQSAIDRLMRAARSAPNIGIVGVVAVSGGVSPVSFLPPECVLIPRGVFRMLGEFDANLEWSLSWADYCLRVIQAGYQLLAVGGLSYLNGKSRSVVLKADASEIDRIRRRWLSGEWKRGEFQDRFWQEALSRRVRPEISVVLVTRAAGTERSVRKFKELRRISRGPTAEFLVADASESWAGAIERAIEHGTGEFIALIDDQVQPVTGWLDGLLKAIRVTANVGAAGPLCDGPVPPWQKSNGRRPGGFPHAVARLSPHCLMLPRRVFDRVGKFDCRLQEKAAWSDYALRILQEGFQLMVAQDSFVRWRSSPAPKRGALKAIEAEDRRALWTKWADHPRFASQLS